MYGVRTSLVVINSLALFLSDSGRLSDFHLRKYFSTELAFSTLELLEDMFGHTSTDAKHWRVFMKWY